MKILAVCGGGTGSSMVLKIYVEKALRQLNIEASVEQSDVTSAGSLNADFIVTSQNFVTLFDASKVIAIKNYLDIGEYISKLEKAVKGRKEDSER
jgi:PTS system ascorbate-specific IIB component